MRTRHVLAATAALALAGSTAGAALTGASAAPAGTTRPSRPSASSPRSSSARSASPRRRTAPATGPTASPACSTSRLPAVSRRSSSPAEEGRGAEGVSADGGVLRFTTGSSDNKAGEVWTLDADRSAVQLSATPSSYEKQANPDGKFKYGLLKTPKSCLAQLPRRCPARTPATRRPTPTPTAAANGVTYVADAGANAVLALSPTGSSPPSPRSSRSRSRSPSRRRRRTTLPPLPVGKKLALEAVPTDVEVGPDGQLYVTSLPGGPEDPSLGANGRVLRIDPATGKVTTVVEGLLSPTGVAVASNGDLYVAQLFLGEISKVKAGKHKAKTYAEGGAARRGRGRPRPACSRPSTPCRWARSPRDRSSRSLPDHR